MTSEGEPGYLRVEKHCEMLSANARHRTDAMAAWFKLYLQLYSAIVGGAVALRLQAVDAKYSALLPRFECLSNWLVAFLGLASILLVIDARRAEYGQRKRLTDVAGYGIVPEPAGFCTSLPFQKRDGRLRWLGWQRGLWQWFGCIGMVTVIFGATIAFWWFNPLHQSRPSVAPADFQLPAG